ncbi:hypothetical protein [Rubrivirga sp. IMCC45206]|uniref:hypothetical protein n=1 Tax=Rubrivirga sp. IMCC45206 TaxID=3391614 RepID=UPI00398FC8B1
MIRPLVLLASLALLAQAPPPQASDLYHTGAQAFIDGDTGRALQAVQAGLALAPDDAKLQALRDLIEQQQDEQDEGGGQQDQPQDGGEGDEGEPEGEGDPPPGEGDSDAEADQTRTQDQQAGAGEAPAQPTGTQQGAMTPEQAERILDAVGGEEQLLLRELRRNPSQRQRSEKDW